MQESISSACSELEELAADPSDKDALAKVDACLDEGAKALHKRQKHIMIADSSDWDAIRHYEVDPLADDEKKIKRAKKELKKESETTGVTYRKRRGGGHINGGYRKRRPQFFMDQPGPEGCVPATTANGHGGAPHINTELRLGSTRVCSTATNRSYDHAMAVEDMATWLPVAKRKTACILCTSLW